MCLICERIDQIQKEQIPYLVKELETGYVVIGDSQYFKGYSLFLAKDHIIELHQLTSATKLKFLEEMSLVQEAVAKAFEAEKMNIELLGNGDAHLHFHIFPRRAADMNGCGPVWWLPWEEMSADRYSSTEQELADLVQQLLDKL